MNRCAPQTVKVRTVRPPAPRAVGWRPLEQLENDGPAELFGNDWYQVHRLGSNPAVPTRASSLEDALWLVVWRRDGKPPRDWRHLQAIKNQLAGPEREALEIFPAESRLIDVGNATHLWVMPAGECVPFGYEGQRRVLDAGRLAGVAQRPLEPPAEPATSSDGSGAARRDVGRNDPCWCGSGKKFKRCHGA